MCIKQMTNEDLLYSRDLSSMLCGDLAGKEIQGGGDICLYVADSICGTAETNTTS